ncbi:MAG TPA: hypothetical protein VGI58_19510 [Streptosporangiaceae bacterium]
MPESPLSVGNGEVCFTVDVTGLQTWPDRYPVADPAGGLAGTLLSTLSTWGWHSLPGGAHYDVSHCARTYQGRRGPVRYVDLSRELGGAGAIDTGEHEITAEEAWLRGNPHRLDLLRMGFVTSAAAGHDRPAWQVPPPDTAHSPVQRLDLWTGVITSSFRLRGEPVGVRTVCHPARDVIAVRVQSRLLAAGLLAIRLAFPYGSASWHNAADWTRPQAHVTQLSRAGEDWVVRRSLDGAPSYQVVLSASAGAGVAATGRHELVVSTTAGALELTVRLEVGAHDQGNDPSDSYAAIEHASQTYWPHFWSASAAVDVTGSTDPRATELQRRIMLSQYLTAINCAGSLPPQETGLTCTSWSGRSHLEMHWWHAAHFAMWGRSGLLERSLGWYQAVLPLARQTARTQGYGGARWPKQCGPDGRETPSSIGPFLLWQQPHPIYLAELARQSADQSAEAMGRHADLVFESARFLADFADRTARGFELGPPLIPAQECYAADRAGLASPTFELAYTAWALDVAQRWRAELGLDPEPTWAAVADGLVRPAILHGAYAAVSSPPQTQRRDHPSMLCAYGFVPPTPLIDRGVMRATLRSVLADWDWASCWGWDFPAIAMTAARLGEPQAAVDALLLDTPKNRFLPNGHNRQGASLPVYLPGNGGLLAAVAHMARQQAAGFPDDGTWRVAAEGLSAAP